MILIFVQLRGTFIIYSLREKSMWIFPKTRRHEMRINNASVYSKTQKTFRQSSVVQYHWFFFFFYQIYIRSYLICTYALRGGFLKTFNKLIWYVKNTFNRWVRSKENRYCVSRVNLNNFPLILRVYVFNHSNTSDYLLSKTIKESRVNHKG